MLKRVISRSENSQVKREDDTPEVFKKRIHVYINETMPIVKSFKDHHKIIELDAEKSPQHVAEECLLKLKDWKLH